MGFTVTRLKSHDFSYRIPLKSYDFSYWDPPRAYDFGDGVVSLWLGADAILRPQNFSTTDKKGA